MEDIIIHNLQEQLDRIEKKIDNRVLKNWLSITDVTQSTGYSKSTINRAIKNGELKSVKNGGKRMFRKEWVDRWISG
jgi:excisionase family DNA binding protein